MLDQCAVLYRALWPHVPPHEVDKLELWQIAALAEDGEPTAQEDPDAASRRFLQERVRAAQEGRTLDAESLVVSYSDTDIQAILANAKQT